MSNVLRIKLSQPNSMALRAQLVCVVSPCQMSLYRRWFGIGTMTCSAMAISNSHDHLSNCVQNYRVYVTVLITYTGYNICKGDNT